MANFTSGYVQDNEVVKAEDINFGFDSQIDNVSKALQLILECKQDFVVGGNVVPYTGGGMNVTINPVFGVSFTTGECFGDTEVTGPVGIPVAEETSRIDIIQLKGDYEEYDEQQRAFNDLETDVKTYKNVYTKKRRKLVVNVKKGVAGSVTAPEVDEGYVKLAEIVVNPGDVDITAENIKNITADVSGLENTDWTNEKTVTYNVGYISDVNDRFRQQHNKNGTHKKNIIGTDELNIGTGEKQVNGMSLPTGKQVEINGEVKSVSFSVADNLVLLATKITDLFNSYLKNGEFNFNDEVAISDLVDDSNNLIKPFKLGAAGDGSAYLKVDNKVVLTITKQKLLRTPADYVPVDNQDLVIKSITDTLNTRLEDLTEVVNNIIATSDNTVYANNVLSRFNTTVNVQAATTINIVLSGLQTIDNVSVQNGYMVLVKNQTDKKENGVYQVSETAWSRAPGYDTADGLKHKFYWVQNGTINKNKYFYTPLETFEFGINDILISEYVKIQTQQIKDKAVTNEKIADSTITEAKVNNSFLQAIFDMIYPADKTVIPQYPGEPNPNDKYNGNGISSHWDPVTEYDNRFFKINSSVAVGTLTNESLPNIRGGVLYYNAWANGDKYYKGAVHLSETPIRDTPVSNLGVGYAKEPSFNAQRTAITNGSDDPAQWTNVNNTAYKDPENGVPVKVQPDNVSYKLWKRTA